MDDDLNVVGNAGVFQWNDNIDYKWIDTTGTATVSTGGWSITPTEYYPVPYQPLPYQPIQYFYPPYQWWWTYPYPVPVQPKLSDEDLVKLADLIAERLKKQD